MNNIKLIAETLFQQIQASEKNKEVAILLNNETHKILQVSLFEGAILNKHSTPSPISVLCLSGNGTFRAGKNLEEEQKLIAGTLIYLEKGILHEAVAEPNLTLLVTKFSE